MAEAVLHCELRQEKGSQAVKAMRRNGKIPAVYYSHGKESVPIVLDEKELSPILHREVNIIDLVFPDKKEQKTIFREIQKDPVTEDVLHLDLMGIKLDENVRLTIPILLKGTPAGVKEGGILEHLLREVVVEGLPLDIPEHLEVDVTDLKIGDVIKLEDITADKFKFVTEIHHAVANVIQPRLVVEEVEEPAEGAEEGAIEGEEASATAEETGEE